MIFLKKIFLSCFIISLACMMTAGCSSAGSGKQDADTAETTSQPFTERAVSSTDGTYIYDKAGLLSTEDMKACNDYAGWLYNNKLINAAVVTVNDLEGRSPYDYAAEQFGEIYEGKGSGLLVLINNDTNEDVVYRTGSCLANISDKAVYNAVYWSTKEIIGDSYRRGIMRLLQLGELCPSHIIDNAQIFEYENISRFEKELSGCKKDVTLIATKNMSDTPDEDIVKEYHKRKYPSGSGIMLMLDTSSKKVVAYSGQKLPSGLDKGMKEINSLASKGDNAGAVNKLIEVLK